MRASQLTEFKATMIFIENYLHDVAKKADFRNILHNKLSVEVTYQLFSHEVSFHLLKVFQ